MSWLPKWFSPGPKEDTHLYLKLRLTRWRHLLRAQRACLNLLGDLREKEKGEYIFDRQYLYATMGQIFQMAYTVAYDQGLLEKDGDDGMYPWLDQLKECATAYLQHWTPDRREVLPEPCPGITFGALEGEPLMEQGPANREWMALQEESGLQELKALLKEPEYRMIKGLLNLLDPQDVPNRPGPLGEKAQTAMTLRQGLYQAHDRVLDWLIPTQAGPQWIKEGTAFQIKGPFPLYAVDLGEMRFRMKSISKTGNPGPTGQRPAFFGSPFGEKPEPSPLLLGTFSGDNPSPMLLVFDRSTLFLMNSSPSEKIRVDAVLTSIRKLNHFFLHWEGGPELRPGMEAWADWFDWDRQKDQTLFEVYYDNKSADEIRGLLKKTGIAWGVH